MSTHLRQCEKHRLTTAIRETNGRSKYKMCIKKLVIYIYTWFGHFEQKSNEIVTVSWSFWYIFEFLSHFVVIIY